MTIHSKQTVYGKEMSFLEHTDFNYISSLGLVTNDCTAKLSGHDKTYSFLHLTFQEYLAAWHIAHLDKEEQMEIIRLYAKKGHMRMVWKFYCGMVEFGEQSSQIELIKVFEPDGEYNYDNEYKSFLHGVQCAFESQQKVVCDYLFRIRKINSSNDIEFFDIILTPADLAALGYVISTTSHSFRRLNITLCQLTDDHLIALVMKISAKKLKNIETLHLIVDNISSNGVKILAGALKSCYELEELNLYENHIDSDGSIELSSVLKSCDKLKKINLSHNHIGPDGANALASAVRSCKKYGGTGSLKQPYWYRRCESSCPCTSIM